MSAEQNIDTTSRQKRFTLPGHRAAAFCHVAVAVDESPDLIHVFRTIIQGNADKPGMQIRLGAQQADPVLLAALELLQPRDDLPNVRACGQCRAAVMSRPPEDDSRMVELISSLNDELIQQRRSGHALPGGA